METESAGYPSEYLVSRIRGRRAGFIKEWDDITLNPGTFESLIITRYGGLKEEIRIGMLREFQWVYNQMNKKLKEIFKPFFIYFEIKTLTACLRYKMKNEPVKEIESLLSFSLLPEGIKGHLKTGEELPAAVEYFEEETSLFSSGIRGLKNVFLKEGLKGVEERLFRSCLEKIIHSSLHPVIRNFFVFTIDSRNIIALYKHLQWDITSMPYFIQGGSIMKSQFEKAAQSKELSGISELVHRLTGHDTEGQSLSKIETLLRTLMTKQIRTMMRDNSDIGLILDYLWRRFIEAQNLSIIFYGRDVEKEVIKRELVTI